MRPPRRSSAHKHRRVEREQDLARFACSRFIARYTGLPSSSSSSSIGSVRVMRIATSSSVRPNSVASYTMAISPRFSKAESSNGWSLHIVVVSGLTDFQQPGIAHHCRRPVFPLGRPLPRASVSAGRSPHTFTLSPTKLNTATARFCSMKSSSCSCDSMVMCAGIWKFFATSTSPRNRRPPAARVDGCIGARAGTGVSNTRSRPQEPDTGDRRLPVEAARNSAAFFKDSTKPAPACASPALPFSACAWKLGRALRFAVTAPRPTESREAPAARVLLRTPFTEIIETEMRAPAAEKGRVCVAFLPSHL